MSERPRPIAKRQSHLTIKKLDGRQVARYKTLAVTPKFELRHPPRVSTARRSTLLRASHTRADSMETKVT